MSYCAIVSQVTSIASVLPRQRHWVRSTTMPQVCMGDGQAEMLYMYQCDKKQRSLDAEVNAAVSSRLSLMSKEAWLSLGL